MAGVVFLTYGVLSLCVLGFAAVFYGSYYLSAKYLGVFRAFSEVQKGEWCSRINSTIHSVVICAGLLYSFSQQEWDAHLMPIHSLDLAIGLFSFSIAYFLFDLYVVYAWKIEHYKVFVAHHIIAMIPYVLYNFYGGCTVNTYLLSMYLLVEICIPPMNLATIVDLLGYKETVVYIGLFYVAYIAWFFARVCLPLYTLYVMWVDFIPGTDWSSFQVFLCTAPPLLCGHVISIFCIGCFVTMITPDVLARWKKTPNDAQKKTPMAQQQASAKNYGALEAV